MYLAKQFVSGFKQKYFLFVLTDQSEDPNDCPLSLIGKTFFFSPPEFF